MQLKRCRNTMSSPPSPSVSLSHFVRTPDCTVTLARSSRSTRFSSRLHLFFRQPRFSFDLSRFKGASLLRESFRLSAHQYSLSSDACVQPSLSLGLFSPSPCGGQAKGDQTLVLRNVASLCNCNVALRVYRPRTRRSNYLRKYRWW